MLYSDPTCYIINSSAIGDIVASLPVLRYGIEKYHNNEDYFIVAPPEFRDIFFFIPDDKFGSVFEKQDFKKVHHMTKLNIIETKLLQFHGMSPMGAEVSEYSIQRLTPLRVHLTQYASLNLHGKVLSLEKYPIPQYPKELLEDINIDKFDVDFSKSVLIPVIYRAENRQWRNKEFDKIISYIKDRDLIPVFIGKTSIEIDQKTPYKMNNSLNLDGINLIDKTSIKELIKIFYKSKSIVGIDNGLIWLAAMTNIPIICAYNIVSPYIRKPFRDDGIWLPVIPDIDCRFCQSKYLINGHDFSECYLKHNLCLDELTANKFIEQLDKIL